MRLLNVDTLEVQDFIEGQIPCYAILSHTWGKEEVSFQELTKPWSTNNPKFSKLLGCCNQASLDGWEYVWIDTCCIDKTSSAELSEAINSMYRWYAEAQVCYTYMSDVDGKVTNHTTLLKNFQCSRWFTRGWTLQELLAPQDIIFFDQGWEEIGTRLSLETEISQVAGIMSRFIGRPEAASVATKMSWASKRRTTRTEDMAYCLLGLFDVNMPLLYGEGKKAFLRLQQEILKATNDESIFAWKDRTLLASGLFAQAPSAFQFSSMITPVKKAEIGREWTITPRGTIINGSVWTVPEAEVAGILTLQPLARTFKQLTSTFKDQGAELDSPEKVQLMAMALGCDRKSDTSGHDLDNVMICLYELPGQPGQLVRVLCGDFLREKAGKSSDGRSHSGSTSVCIRQFCIPYSSVLFSGNQGPMVEHFMIKQADHGSSIRLIDISTPKDVNEGRNFTWGLAGSLTQRIHEYNPALQSLVKIPKGVHTKNPYLHMIFLRNGSESADFAFQTVQGESFAVNLWVQDSQTWLRVTIPPQGEKVELAMKRHHRCAPDYNNPPAKATSAELTGVTPDRFTGKLQGSNYLSVSMRKQGFAKTSGTVYMKYVLVEIAVGSKLSSRNIATN